MGWSDHCLGERGPETKGQSLLKNPKFFSIQSSHSKIITHSFKQLFHQFIHFLFCKKAKQYVVATCLFHFAIQGMSRKQRRLFSARLLTKIFICINIHHSLSHLKIFIEQLYALISVLDAQIHDRNLLS